MPHRRNQIEGLAARGTYWNFLLAILQITHRNRFPADRPFAADLPLVVCYGAVMLNYSRGKATRATDLVRSLGMSRETARRHLAEIAALGLVDHDGPLYRPGRRVAKRHLAGTILTKQLLRQMVISLEALERE
jgi:hypothetical protein